MRNLKKDIYRTGDFSVKIVPCDTGAINYTGASGIFERSIDLTTNLGIVEVTINTINVPDRVLLKWNNNIVADSLFVADGLNATNPAQFIDSITNTNQMILKTWDGYSFISGDTVNVNDYLYGTSGDLAGFGLTDIAKYSSDSLRSSGSGITSGGYIRTSGKLIIGRTYQIDVIQPGDDFTGTGFTTLGVSFVASGTTPVTWTNGTEVYLINEVKTSGYLRIGRTYQIDTLNGTDDFTNVGFISTGVPFIATGTTPTDWSGLTTVKILDGIYQSNVVPNYPSPTALTSDGDIKLYFNKNLSSPAVFTVIVIGVEEGTQWDIINIPCPEYTGTKATTGNADAPTACLETTTDTIYFNDLVNIGTFVYTDQALTTPYVGAGIYYKVFTPLYEYKAVKIEANGSISDVLNC